MNLNNGYKGYSMSNRASEAYEAGEKPISKWTKADIITEIAAIDPIKAESFKKVCLKTLKGKVLKRSSWHHTSSRCNKTDFYTLNEDYIKSADEKEILALYGKSEKTDEKKTFKGAIYYLEWSGTKKHPKATEKCLENVNIEERGCYYYVTDDAGNELLKKKISSNGTRIIDYVKEAEREAKAKEREKRIRELSSKAALSFYDSIKESCERSVIYHIY